MAMSPMMMMYLCLAVLVVVLFFLFVMPEMKSRVGGIPHNLMHNINALAKKSLHTGEDSDLSASVFSKTVGSAKKYNEELYALGGGYDTYAVPYGKDETNMELGSKSEKISGGDWAKKFKHSVDHPTDLEPIHERHNFSSPYARNDAHFTKSHSRLPGKHWEKKFEHHPADGVTNHHSHHPAKAGHGLHEVHRDI